MQAVANFWLNRWQYIWQQIALVDSLRRLDAEPYDLFDLDLAGWFGAGQVARVVGIEHTLGGGSDRKVPGIKLSAELPYFPAGVCDTLAEAMPPGGCWACETTCQIGCELFCTTQYRAERDRVQLDGGGHGAGDDVRGDDAVGNDDASADRAVGDDAGRHTTGPPTSPHTTAADFAAHDRATHNCGADVAAHAAADCAATAPPPTSPPTEPPPPPPPPTSPHTAAATIGTRASGLTFPTTATGSGTAARGFTSGRRLRLSRPPFRLPRARQDARFDLLTARSGLRDTGAEPALPRANSSA